MISMNYENVYRYLCFCCVDAVDCRELTWMSMDRYGLGRCVASLGVLPPHCRPSGLRIKSAMTWTMLMRRFHPHPSPLP